LTIELTHTQHPGQSPDNSAEIIYVYCRLFPT